MSLTISLHRNSWTRRAAKLCITPLSIVLIALCGAVGVASADDEEATDIWDALIHGKPTLNFRARVEIADRDTNNRSEAYTFRTRLGYGTKPFKGFSLFGDFENIAAIASEQYGTPGNNPNNLTIIADPPLTEVNQIYLKVANKKLLDSALIGGRQRIILDDSRFIGNVGWRQNEQTYDAVLLQSKLNRDDSVFTYSWIGNQHNVIGNTVSTNAQVLNGSFSGIKPLKMVGFIYLLDFPDFPLAATPSSATFGFRGSGKVDFAEKWMVAYQASYAYQMDYGNQPIAYGAHYFLGDVKAGHSSAGNLGIGFEMLGSDDGVKQFQTPLATLHKFNGWADAFLNNGGPGGLRDLFVYIEPKLPCKFAGKLVYHRFWNDSMGDSLGWEIDGQIKRPINEHLDVLVKGAYFNAETPTVVLQDIYRFWVDVVVKF